MTRHVRAVGAPVSAALTVILGACGGAGPGAQSAGPSGAAGDGAWTRTVDAVPVTAPDGTPYTFPFLGGLDVPRPQFVDIDGDADLDLFVQERTGALLYFENEGTARDPRFVWRTDHYQDLDIGEWSRFVDLDQDGDLDLLAEQRFSYVRYFENQGGPMDPRFVAVGDSVRDASGDALFSDRQNIPNLTDIDCDGRWDLFLGRVDGTVTRYEQVEPGPDGLPRFGFVTERFQGIEIVNQIGGSMHGANAMAFADVDEDGDQDLFWGDFFEPGVLLIPNSGSCQTPALATEPEQVSASPDLLTSGYNVPVPVDLDADGDLDLAVGVLGGAFNPNRSVADNFHYYRTEADGRRVRVTRRLLDGIDIGSESALAAGDIDGDGDVDLLLGNKLEPLFAEQVAAGQAVPQEGRMYVLRNEGTATAPAFRLSEPLDFGPWYHGAPELVDLDADGDLDLLLGTWRHGVHHYRNDGGDGAHPFVLADSALVELGRGSNATPAAGDLDGDGDADLIVGESSGELNHYRNVGDPGTPRFELVTEKLGGFDAGRRSYPTLQDVDADGDLDLLVGTEAGPPVLYRNVGSASDARFEEDPTYTLPLFPFSIPRLTDLDGDGRAELLSGTLGGGVVLYQAR